MTDDLKPCPFCECGVIESGKVRDFPDDLTIVPTSPRCHNCGAEARNEEAWNTRPAEDALHREVEEMRALVRDLCPLAMFWARHHVFGLPPDMPCMVDYHGTPIHKVHAEILARAESLLNAEKEGDDASSG